MADEVAVLDPNQEDKKTKSLIFVLMALSIIVMVLTPLITIYTFRVMSKEVKEPIELKKKGTEVSLPSVQVNVAGTNGTRYAKIDIVLQVSDPDIIPYINAPDDGSDAPDNQSKRIMATIIEVVGDKPLPTLLSTDGKRNLANEIKGALNDLLARFNKGMITDVYFYGFLIQ